MVKDRLTLATPNVREYAHGLAYKLAREQLAGIEDIAGQCRRSETRYLPAENAVMVDYLNQPYRLSLTDGEITGAAGEAVPLRDKILILHYFTRAKGTPLSGKMITYKEILEGINYYPTFFKRAVEPIINHFKDQPQKLLEIAGTLGGGKSDFGDIGVTIPAFSRVPLTLVLWCGDKEFPPDGNIMFDRTITDYLPTEDITILCENIAWQLVRLLKSGGEHSGKD